MKEKVKERKKGSGVFICVPAAAGSKTGNAGTKKKVSPPVLIFYCDLSCVRK